MFEPTSRTDRAELEALEKQEKKISALTRTAFEQEQVAREKLETATHAVNADPANEQLQLFKHRKEQQYSSAHNQLSALREEGERLDAKKKQKQAFYSQSELLDFIHSGRYSLTPMNYAKAMAGVPWVSWRQSAERLQDFEFHHPYGIEYEKFRIVEKALRTRPRSCAKAVDQLKTSLLRTKSGRYAVKKLKSEWYFLKVSIDAVYQQKTDLPAIPYRVFAEYQSRTRAKSSADLLWEEEESLS